MTAILGIGVLLGIAAIVGIMAAVIGWAVGRDPLNRERAARCEAEVDLKEAEAELDRVKNLASRHMYVAEFAIHASVWFVGISPDLYVRKLELHDGVGYDGHLLLGHYLSSGQFMPVATIYFKNFGGRRVDQEVFVQFNGQLEMKLELEFVTTPMGGFYKGLTHDGRLQVVRRILEAEPSLKIRDEYTH